MLQDDPRTFRVDPPTFDPWEDCGWATFQDGDEVVDENIHFILGWKLCMNDDECVERKAELCDIWYDIGQDARDRYVSDFKKYHADRVRQMFNDWYKVNRGRYEDDE